jgi:hypothetical protein
MTIYRHTQIGRAILYSTVITALVALLLAGLFPGARMGIVISVILLVVAGLFSRLTITIDDDYLRASFGPGLVLRKIKVAEIDSCDPIRIRWWYGWGIHLTPYGWLYNVSGFDAVVVTLRNRRRVSLGTDEPAQLAAAIRRAASAR